MLNRPRCLVQHAMRKWVKTCDSHIAAAYTWGAKVTGMLILLPANRACDACPAPNKFPTLIVAAVETPKGRATAMRCVKVRSTE